MIERSITGKMKEMLTKFPIVSLTGPRQSGKSTLLRKEFPDYNYISLEDPDILLQANSDPRGFLISIGAHSIIDEAQNCPALFSYLQTAVDETGESGQYILSGSQNFLLMEKISQSLAGRVYVMFLPPLSYSELKHSHCTITTTEQMIYTGGYPRLYDKQIDPHDYFPSYIRTYIERDVRSIKRITDLAKFNVFVRLCATRVGQILNVSSLANDCGISVITANEWLSVLESSYIIFKLPPFYNNHSKRLTKSPKLYFYDTGLACSLLGFNNENQLQGSDRYGALFENMVIAEELKNEASHNRGCTYYYWRDSNNVEIDLLKSDSLTITMAEIKSGSTADPHYTKSLSSVGDLLDIDPVNRIVIYDGLRDIRGKDAMFINWRNYLDK